MDNRIILIHQHQPFSSSTVDGKQAGEVSCVVDVPEGRADDQHGSHVVDAARQRDRVDAANLGRK